MPFGKLSGPLKKVESFIFLKRSGRGSNPGPRASEEDALSTPLRLTWRPKSQSFSTTFLKPNGPYLTKNMPQSAHETLIQASSCRTLSEGDLSRMVSWAMFADKSWENTKLNRIYQEVLMGNNSYARDPPSTRLVSAIVNNPFLPSESVQTGKYHIII